MSQIGPCVSVFGSARTKPDDPNYQLAIDIASEICNHGYGVITGGGPGIMEAGNKGANQAGGTSVGLNIDLPFEQHDNPFIDSDGNFIKDLNVDSIKNTFQRNYYERILKFIETENLKDLFTFIK